jgi:hypothetical protein
MNITDFVNTRYLDDDAYLESKHLSVSRKGDLTLIKYKKECIQEDNIANLGVLRSLIFKGNQLVCYSPPKSYNSMELPVAGDIQLEEYVEGTMINVFHDGEQWRIASRSKIDAETTFRVEGEYNKSFAEMFEDAKKETTMSFELLDQKYCYSFTLQHPSNRIVAPIEKPQLILCAVYHIEDNIVKEICIHNNPELDMMFRKSTVLYIQLYEKNSIDIHNAPYYIQGVVWKVDGKRYKCRNLQYNYVRNLRGNQAKLQYHYYCLRRQYHKVHEFLQFFPEYATHFQKYEQELQLFASNLYQHYVDCFIYKKNHIQQNPYELKNHMHGLHQIYHQTRKNMNMYVVQNYLSQLEPARLMYTINYNKRSVAAVA